MKNSCRDCKQWMEHFYWTHSEHNGLHFFRILPRGFTRQLMIPRKFMMHLKEELSEIVLLKGPSGTTWQVGLTEIAGDIFFKSGWPRFVEDHSIKREDFLLFRYDGNSCFNVLMFDKNGCEKEDSYFVGKFKSSCFHKGSRGQDKTIEDSVDVMDLNRAVCSNCAKRKFGSKEFPVHCKESRSKPSSSITPSKRGRKRKLLSLQQFKHLNTPSSTLKMKKNARRTYSSRAVHELKNKDFLARLESTKPHAKSSKGRAYRDKQENIETPDVGNLTYSLYFISKRRPVTEEEISRAHQLACDARQSIKCFIRVMTPSTVYRRFYMSIPAEFVNLNLPRKSQNITLRVPSGKLWVVRYNCVTSNKGALDVGWSDFVMDNNLEEGDSCLFELVSGKINNILMDVRIFRVIEEVVPLTRYTKTRVK